MELLGSHDMQDEYRLAVVAINDPARWLNELSVARPLELDQFASALGVILQLADVLEYAGDEHCRGVRVLQRDVVADSVKIAKGWLRPDYLSHRAMRVLAWA